MSRSVPASNWYPSSAGQRAVDPKNTHNKHKGKSYLSVGCHKSIYFGGLSQVYAFENNMSSHNHQRAVTETTTLRVTRRKSVGFNQLTGVNLSAAARTRMLTKTSLIISVRGQMSGSAGICPHGDIHFNVKGRGPVSISTDLKAVSAKHRLLYMSTSIECHCCTQSHEMSGPLPYTGGERPLAVDHGIAVTHQVGNRMKSAVLIIEVTLMKRR